ncbi:NUDIX domain-containing protein [Staphylococcus sp. IVB6246]|uniref:NUDIX domain-containing protein n=1 Tax=unclassified Staphylococcus TaxID=91994 RepID=UPI0021D38B84|nr:MULTISPECIES: NUDIX domain-containing protein [unclassified Staphylococcus]UXR69988.1 NUDIX domain-containing protein [Staphylococcus sp. IVB6246]UXR72029.1 NUDIX domain-containing protein [Staphylococcus sp. IVB6240]UXR74337.1 NUDIX domain-containing protein [Staphylococcus sp. IVB6238]
MNIIIFGFSQYTHDLYWSYLNDKTKFNKIVIVDLQSSKDEIVTLTAHSNVTCDTYFLDDDIKHMRQLPSDVYQTLQNIVTNEHITHAIIATEPRSHDIYIDFCLNMNLHILCDTPLTLPMYTNTPVGASSIIENYEKIIKKWQSQTDTLFELSSLERAHKGYQYVYEIIENIVKTYQVPIHKIHVSSTKNNLVNPNDMILQESQPYKYGYGHLMHEGHHLIDLLTFFANINKKYGFIERRKAYRVSDYRPNDFYRYYGKLLNQSIHGLSNDKIYDNLNILKYFGEFELHTAIDYMDESEHKIMTGTIDLSHSSHTQEIIEISIGPLITVKIINDTDHHYFDIHIYRNSQFIDGKPFEIIKLEQTQDHFLTQTTHFDLLDDFFLYKQSHTNILDHQEEIEILTHIHQEMAQKLDMSQFRFAVELIIEHNGKILVCRRRPDVKIAPGVWNVPAGKVQYNESMDAAIIREAKEETNLDISDFSCLGYQFINKAHQRCVYTYHVHVDDISNLIIDTGEFDQYDWIDASNVDNYDSLNPHIRDAIIQLTHV